MIDTFTRCRHGRPYNQYCDACSAKHHSLEQLRKDERRIMRMAIAIAQASGRNHTFVYTDGCEVIATPDGHVFFNMADWY